MDRRGILRHRWFSNKQLMISIKMTMRE